MSRFRSAHKTVVTEIKSFVVDTVARVSTFRQSVSARVPGDSILSNSDFNVSLTQDKVFDDVKGVVGIHTPEPVRVQLIQTGSVEEPEEPEPVGPMTAVLACAPTVKAGSSIIVSLTDTDLPLIQKTTEVTVFNASTGETEKLILNRKDDVSFSGQIATSKNVGKGDDFDDVLNVEARQYVRVLYTDPTGEDGNAVTVEAGIDIESPFVDSDLRSVPFIYPGKRVPVLVTDADLAGQITTEATLINTRTNERETVVLTEVEDGTFYGNIRTRAETAPTDGDNVLDVIVGDTLAVTFFDEQFDVDPETSVSIEVHETKNVNGIITSGAPEAEVNAEIEFIMTDYNQSGIPYLDLPISNLNTNEYEMVRFVEVRPHFGVFKGTLRTTDQDSQNNDGMLKVKTGDVVQAVYVDNNSVGGAPLRVSHDVTIIEPVVPVALEPVSIVPAVPSGLDTAESTRTVEMIVDGLFFLNGNFPGKVRVVGLKDDLTRCSVLHV